MTLPRDFVGVVRLGVTVTVATRRGDMTECAERFACIAQFSYSSCYGIPSVIGLVLLTALPVPYVNANCNGDGGCVVSVITGASRCN